MTKDKIEFFFWKFFERIIQFIGINRIPPIAKILSALFFYIIPVRKDVVVKNLKIAFPEKSEKEISTLARKNFQSTAQTFLELLLIPKMTEANVKEQFAGDELQLVIDKLNENRGILFLTAHLSNWELGAIYIGMVLNKKIRVLVKRQRNILVADWMTKVRERFGNVEITLGTSVREIIKTLSKNGVVGIVGDQRGPKDGVRINFFNQPTMTYSGFAVMALKLRPPILVATGKRTENGKYQIHFSEITYDNLPEKNEEAIQELNQRYMSIVEEGIRRAPDQYLWMHNIWKY